MKHPEIRQKMEQMNDFILDAETKLREGTMTDLTGLDKEVAVICTNAVALPPAEAHDLQPLMAELIGNLERLSMALKDYRDDLKK